MSDAVARISELPPGVTPIDGSTLFEVSVVEPTSFNGYDSKSYSIYDLFSEITVPTVFTDTVLLAADPTSPLEAATKQYVDSHAGSGGGTAGVSSFNTRTGAVTLNYADVTTALGYTPYNSTNPAGYQTAEQVAAALGPYALTSAIPIASTSNPLMDGTVSVGVENAWSHGDHRHPTDTTRAPLNSPIFTGTPSLPTGTIGVTQPPGTNTSALATTLFVTNAIASISVVGVTSFNTRTGAVTLSSTDVTNALGYIPYNSTNPAGYQTAAQVSALIPAASSTLPLMDGVATVGVENAWSHGDHRHPTDTTRAPLNSPIFTGTPSLPTGTIAVTQAVGDSSTALATTAWVKSLGYSSTSGATVSDTPPSSPVAGQLWVDSTTFQLYCWYADDPSHSNQWVALYATLPAARYGVSFSFVGGVLPASQLLGIHPFSKNITFGINFAGWLGHTPRAGGSANTTASTTITLQKALAATPNTWTNIGTIVFASGTVAPTFSTGGIEVSFASGDLLRAIAPATPDSTFANFYCTLIARES